jgi:hypothetical protein
MKIRAWCKDNELELALVILGFVAGLQFGRVAGRHEK